MKTIAVKRTVAELANAIHDESGFHTQGEYTSYDRYVFDKLEEEILDNLDGILDDLERNIMSESEFMDDERMAAAERRWEAEAGR